MMPWMRGVFGLVPLLAWVAACGDGGPMARAEPSVRLAVIGDYGDDSPAEARVAALVHAWGPDHVLTVGDNNYPSGGADTIDRNIGKHYQAFIGHYRGDYGSGSERNRFWPSPGNHDWQAWALAPYSDYFTLPHNERYYDVRLGPVHLFSLDSAHEEPDGRTADSKQAAWLRARLAASKACWKLVTLHHGPYSSGEHGSDLQLRWPFAAWGADAVLSGHDHHYERLAVDGIWYFVNGLGGRHRYDIPGPRLPGSEHAFNGDQGALLLEASPNRLDVTFRDTSGQRIDGVRVEKRCRVRREPA